MSKSNPMHHGKGDDTFDEQSEGDEIFDDKSDNKMTFNDWAKPVIEYHNEAIKHWINNSPLTRSQIEAILTHAHDSEWSIDDNCKVLCEQLLSYLDKATDMNDLPF